jgi:UDP-N-acetylglucosamine 2-epimerase
LKKLTSNGLLSKIENSRIELVKPMDYFRFVSLLAGSNKVITDSGGVRREAFLLKKPCIVLIELSWFPEIADAGWKVLTAPDRERIANLINHFEPPEDHPSIFGDGKAHLRILEDLEERFGP